MVAAAATMRGQQQRRPCMRLGGSSAAAAAAAHAPHELAVGLEGGEGVVVGAGQLVEGQQLGAVPVQHQPPDLKGGEGEGRGREAGVVRGRHGLLVPQPRMPRMAYRESSNLRLPGPHLEGREAHKRQAPGQQLKQHLGAGGVGSRNVFTQQGSNRLLLVFNPI